MTILSMLFKGVPGDEQVYRIDFDGSGWLATVTIPQIVTASHPFWARYYDQTLFMAWHDTSSPSRVQAGRFDGPDSLNWFGAVPGATSDAAPAGAFMGTSDFMLIWKAVGGSGLHAAIFDSLHWGPSSIVTNAQTSHPPALALFDNKMHLVWKGPVGDHNVYHATYAGGAWSVAQPVPGVATTSQPALVVYGGALFLVFKGAEGDHGIYWSSLASSASAWLAPTKIADFATGTGPAVVAFSGRLHLVWKGVGDDYRLNTANFDGNFWWPRHEIPGVASSSTPSLAEFDPAF
jgi:hypothetical protein